MILFLDAVSPIPKFILIDNNKVIESLHILDDNFTKISDTIVNKFQILEKKQNFLELLKHLIVFNGPGSYTGLRVGISFMFGLSYSKNIPIYGINCTQLLSKFILKKDFFKTIIIVCSSKDQNFICFPINYQGVEYRICKINNNNSFDKFDLKKYSKCISNFDLTNNLKNSLNSKIKNYECIDIEDNIHEELLYTLSIENFLQPIYVSDNKLFE